MSYLVYCLYRTFSEVIALLPLRVGFVLGRLLGTLAYYLAGPYRGLVLKNLRIAFDGEKSPAEIRRLAREHFATLGANLLSSFKLATMNSEEISEHVITSRTWRRCTQRRSRGRVWSWCSRIWGTGSYSRNWSRMGRPGGESGRCISRSGTSISITARQGCAGALRPSAI